MSITLNPNIQTSALGSFILESDGLICGTAWPDPAARFALSGGILSATELLPIWGGVAITEHVANMAVGQPRPELGGNITRATADADLTGWAVFDQNYAAINTPQSPVPQTAPGGFVAFYRLGSGIRLALPMDPALVLGDLPINTPLGWDYANQWLIAGALPIRALRVFGNNCMAAVYDGGRPLCRPVKGS